MTKIEFEIPNEVVEQAAKDKIAQLEKQIKSLETKIKRRDEKIQQFEDQAKYESMAIKAVREFLDNIKYDAAFEDMFHVDRYDY